MAPYHTTIGEEAAAQMEKVLNDFEVPKKGKFVNDADAKVLAGSEKTRRRQRQRERKMHATSKDSPAAIAAIKQQGMISTDSYTTYICNLLKKAETQVKVFVKETFEKISSKAAYVTKGKRTPKGFIEWRAQVPNSDLKRIAKLRSQLANEAVPDGTTAVSCFTRA